jgi:lipopolysaccharide export system protein LptA
MKRLTHSFKFFFFCVFLILNIPVFSQTVTDTIAPTPPEDTVTEFEIIRGPSMRSIYVDSTTTLQTIAGGAIVKQGNTLFYGDSIAVNPTTHVAEAFGHVRIDKNDSVQTTSNYVKYTGTDKTAFLTGDVVLKDGKSTLYTQALDYNLRTGIGNYHNSGKVITGKTTIVSKDGTYYEDTKDIFFKNDVVLNDPETHLTTDSLLYNMNTGSSDFYTDSYIKNKQVEIYSSEGHYDMNTGNALFTSRTTVKDSSNRIYIANHMAIDNKSGIAQLEGNALVKDSASGFIVIANQIFLNNKSNTFLATRKPVLIIKQKEDSIYVAADTIFSGFENGKTKDDILKTEDSLSRDTSIKQGNERQQANSDSIKSQEKIIKVPNADSLPLIKVGTDSLQREIKGDTSHNVKLPGNNTGIDLLKKSGIKKDTSQLEKIEKPSVISLEDTSQILKLNTDSSRPRIPAVALNGSDSSRRNSIAKNLGEPDSLENSRTDTLDRSDTIRYFLAFHHVRVYSDSLQSVCDSLTFSGRDSVFHLYDNPVIWNNRTQIAGDTIFLYTKNKKPDKLSVFDRGIIVNKTAQGFYNQITGKTIEGNFVNGSIDYMRVRGTQAESVYYAQDQDSAYLGMNRAMGDVIDLYFKKGDLQKVVFVNNVSGNFYPMKKIPDEQRFLKGFTWLDNIRPKNKLELFE